MRSTREILQQAQGGQMPSHAECYYAMVALHNRMNFWYQDLIAIGEKKDSLGAVDLTRIQVELRAKHETLVRDMNGFLNEAPDIWLGPTNDPMSPDFNNPQSWSLLAAERAERMKEFQKKRLSGPGDFNP